MPFPPAQLILKRLAQFFFLFSFQLSFASAPSDSGQAVAVRVEKLPALGSLIFDEIWSKSIPVVNFVQRELHEGMPATERTEVRLLYDDNAIYVGVSCYDSLPEGIVVGSECQIHAAFL